MSASLFPYVYAMAMLCQSESLHYGCLSVDKSCDTCRLKSHKAELQEKEKAWKESEKAYKKERESLDKAEKELAQLEVNSSSFCR